MTENVKLQKLDAMFASNLKEIKRTQGK